MRSDERCRDGRAHAVAEHRELVGARGLEHPSGHPRQDLGDALLDREVVVLRSEHAPVQEVEVEALLRHVLDEAAARQEFEDVWAADAEVGDEEYRRPATARRLVAIEPRLVPLVDLHARRLAGLRLDRVRQQAVEIPHPADVALELVLPLLDRLGRRVGGESCGEPLDDVGEALWRHIRLLLASGWSRSVRSRYIWNIEPSFIASPMSPLTLSLPDMKSIWPDCLPESMSSQSWAEICKVKCGFVPAPGFTAHVPSLITACQVPPPSPLTSYWITALVPAALSVRNREAIPSKVSFTVGILASLVWGCLHRAPAPEVRPSKGKEVHTAGDGEHGARDVARALRAQERHGVGHVLRLPLALHRDALHHPLVERAQLRVGGDDPGRDRVARHIVAGALERDRSGEADQPDLAGRVRGLAEAAHEAGDRGHADDAAPAPLAHPREHGLRHLVGAGDVYGQVELPVLVTHVLELRDGVDEPGGVHADVDRAQIARDAAHHVLDLRRLADVADVAAGPPAGGLDLAGGLGGAVTVQVQDRDRAALGGQCLRVGLPETPRGARDQRDLAADAEVHLLALEARLALGEERLDAFRGVLGLEGLEERADLDVDRLVDRSFEPFVDRLDDEPGRDRRALGDEAGKRRGLVGRLAFFRTLVCSCGRYALLRGDLRAEDQELERLRAADQPWHPLRAAEAGRDPEVRLGLPHPRALFEEPEVAGHRDLAAAAERVAVDRGDDGLGEPLDLPHHAVTEADEGVDVVAGEGRAEVGAGAEDAVARPGDDDRVHRVVALHRVERGVEVAHELDADRVGRRTVERDDREALLAREEQGLKRHGRRLP